MYIQTILLAALSAGAFADTTHTIFLTAFAPADTDCTSTPTGNNVTVTTPFLEPFDPKAMPVKGPCMVYTPGSSQNIQFEYLNDSFVLTAYSEPNCRNETAYIYGTSNKNSYCIPMNTQESFFYENNGSDWQSIQLEPVYRSDSASHT